MAHRCRTCTEAHFAMRSVVDYPRPEELAALDPFMPLLLEASREFVNYGWTTDEVLTPEQMEAAQPFLATAIASGAESVTVDGILWTYTPGSALEFAEWLAIECRQHAASFARARGTG